MYLKALNEIKQIWVLMKFLPWMSLMRLFSVYPKSSNPNWFLLGWVLQYLALRTVIRAYWLLSMTWFVRVHVHLSVLKLIIMMHVNLNSQKLRVSLSKWGHFIPRVLSYPWFSLTLSGIKKDWKRIDIFKQNKKWLYLWPVNC